MSGRMSLSFGVAEPAVVLDEPRTILGEHDPGVQHTDVGHPVRCHTVDCGGEELFGQLRLEFGRYLQGPGAKAPIPPVLRPVLPSPDTLVVLRGNQRT